MGLVHFVQGVVHNSVNKMPAFASTPFAALVWAVYCWWICTAVRCRVMEGIRVGLGFQYQMGVCTTGSVCVSTKRPVLDSRWFQVHDQLFYISILHTFSHLMATLACFVSSHWQVCLLQCTGLLEILTLKSAAAMLSIGWMFHGQLTVLDPYLKWALAPGWLQ